MANDVVANYYGLAGRTESGFRFVPVRHAGEFAGADEVVALTVARNTASWGLMKRLGMQRREDLDFDNAEFDKEDPVITVYSIDRASWTAHRG
mgnify:CR=1 FL=1